MDPNRQQANGGEQGGTRAAPPGNVANPRARWRWLIPVVYVIYGLLAVAAAVLVIIDFTKAGEDAKFKRTLALVGFFPMAISIPISLWGILNHAIHFTRPSLQKYIVRILWTVPTYALMSWFALRYTSSKVYLDAVRELYEALAIYNFVFYIVSYFADEVPDLESKLATKDKTSFPIPLCRLKRQPSLGMVHKCKLGVLSYTVVRIIATIITVVTHLTGNNVVGDLAPSNPYFWVCLLVTVTQVLAMFSLSLLRMATYEELQPLPRFFKQFMGIHILIFFTNYQGSLINLLAKTGTINPHDNWYYEDEFAFATMLQDFVICFEMVVLAAFFTYSFEYQRYVTDEPKQNIAQICLYMFTVTSMKSSVLDHLKKGGNNTNEGYQGDHAQSQQPTAAQPRVV